MKRRYRIWCNTGDSQSSYLTQDEILGNGKTSMFFDFNGHEEAEKFFGSELNKFHKAKGKNKGAKVYQLFDSTAGKNIYICAFPVNKK